MYKLKHWQFRVKLSKVYEHGLGLGPFSSGPDFDLLSNFQIYPISLIDHKKRGWESKTYHQLGTKKTAWGVGVFPYCSLYIVRPTIQETMHLKETLAL